MKKICIDPGHGGTDSGAAANGIREEDINLRVALAVRSGLQAIGHTVAMTRTSDIDVGLTARGRFSVAQKADVFLSIHHDAGTNSARGCSAFYWSRNTPNGKDLATQVSEAVAAEWDLPFAYNGNSPDDNRRMPARVHWISLGVLRGGDNWKHVTAALVECCFLTNAKDSANIKRDDYVPRTAAAIVRGIQAHVASEWPDDDSLQTVPGAPVKGTTVKIIDASTEKVITEYEMAHNGDHIEDQGKLYVIGGSQ